MLRRLLIAAICSAAMGRSQTAAPAESEQIRDSLTNAALLLRDGPATAFLAMFDPKMPGFAQISKDVTRAVADAMVDSQITVANDEGSDGTRNLQLDWKLKIAAHDTPSGITGRTARVTATVNRRDGNWVFTAFAPADFFRPGAGRQAWDLVASASSQLRNGSPPGFLSDFDRKMPGYDRLVEEINGLVQVGQIDSSLELTSIDGTDTERNLEIDWTMTISQGVFGGRTGNEGNVSAQRHETVRIKIALQGKKWRVVSLEPLSFFAPTPIVR